MKRNIPPYFVLNWDFNKDELEYYDVMPHLVRCWKDEKKRKRKLWNLFDSDDNTKMPETFEEFKKFIIRESMHQFMSRCEYEVIVTGWPKRKNEKKIDVFKQIKANIDVVTKHFMDYIKS